MNAVFVELPAFVGYQADKIYDLTPREARELSAIVKAELGARRST